MTEPFHIAVFIGSLRADSNSRRIVAALQEVAPPSLRLRTIPIANLPLYNEDFETDAPPVSYGPFRTMMNKAQALLFVTPEYNRSIADTSIPLISWFI